MLTDEILNGMEEFAKTDKYHGAMYDTIMTLIEEVRRLKNKYESELISCTKMNEHDKMYACKYHRYVDDMLDMCLQEDHYGEYSLDEEGTERYNPLWEECKKCREWKKKSK